jgi:hypothetical protein
LLLKLKGENLMAVQQLSCPGSRDNAVQLTNEFTSPAGIGHPMNSGECQIFIDALDSEDNSLKQLALDPGDSRDWFSPPAGTVSIWVVCSSSCSGRGELTYDTPVS